MGLRDSLKKPLFMLTPFKTQNGRSTSIHAPRPLLFFSIPFWLLPHHEPYAAMGVLVYELAVITQGKTAARDITRARIRVELDGILISGGIDEMQGLVRSLHDVQGNLSSLGHHCVVQCNGGIIAHQGRMSPPIMTMIAIPMTRTMVAIPRRRAMTMTVAAVPLVRGTRMWMMMMVIVAAGEQPAHCEKGNGSGEFLPSFQCKHLNPSCLLNRQNPFGCIIPKGDWKKLNGRLKYHKEWQILFSLSDNKELTYRFKQFYFSNQAK